MAEKPSEPLFENLVISGVGLLGGSLGLAAKRRGLAKKVIGAGRNPARLQKAQNMGALDDFTTDLGAACEDADGVVLCGPISIILEQVYDVMPAVPPGAVVTDVGSTKRSIVHQASQVERDDAFFVGSHPMAGSEKGGAENAREDLYDGATCILTPTINTNEGALEKVRMMWEALGMQVVDQLPARHDELLALLSHLPHIVAAALVAQVEVGTNKPIGQLRKIAGPGFRDTTRIAMGGADIWLDIFSDNSANMRTSLNRMIEILEEVRDAIQEDDRPRLEAFLDHAADLRKSFS